MAHWFEVLACGLSMLACAILSASVLVPNAAWADDAERGVDNDIGNIRNNVSLVDDDMKKAREKERRYPLDRRFVEAGLAYDRGNFSTAAVMLTDLVQNAEFQVRSDYADALQMLGDSLYRLRNYAGAKRYLDKLIISNGGKHFQSALAELVDIAVRMHRMEDVEVLAKRLESVPSDTRKSELLYQFGRSFFLAGDSGTRRSYLERSRQFLDQIQIGETRWAASRFYIGAALVALGKQDDAMAEFKRVADALKAQSTDPNRKPDPVVADYVYMALGRMLLQQKKFDEAAENYARIDRKSPIYEEALFELSATYVASAKPKRALEVLDILLLTVSDDNVAVQAAVLRGRINMLDKQFEKADAAYKEVVERYSAIEGELRNFAAVPKNLEQFFAWLLVRGSEDYAVIQPVSNRVAKYLERDEDMLRVVSVFDNMAAERADVKESAKIANVLDTALRASARLDMFPDLKDAWVRLAESQNRCIVVGKRITELLRDRALPIMSSEEKGRSDGMMQVRKKLEEAYSKIPPDAGSYIKRQNRVVQDFTNLSGDVGLLKAQLASVKEQLLSVEKMLNERLFGGEGVVLTKDLEKTIRDGLQGQKDEIRRVAREIEELSQAAEVAAQTVGAGDKVSADENTIRAALLSAQRYEMQVYVDAIERSGGDPNRLRASRLALEKLYTDIWTLISQVQERASERLGGIKKILAVEQRNISEYQSSMRTYEDDARDLARNVGNELVLKAQRRLSDVLLEADLGLVDVAWQRKQQKATTIRELQDERGQRIKSLGDVLQNLTGDAEGEE
ncbi:MAG: hypothetical protein EXR77_00990 [Myxococcales bacterium]|nr:hypothetical protein [Myxococcales bacterium]